MSEVQRIDRSTSKGKGQTGGRPGSRAPMWQLLLVCLVVLTGAVLVTACDEATAPDNELGNGFGPYGVAHLVAAESGSNVAKFNGAGAYGLFRLAAGESKAQEMADTNWQFAGSYGSLRLAAGESGPGNVDDGNLTVFMAAGDSTGSASAKPAEMGLDVPDKERMGISAWFDADRYLVRSDAQRFASAYRSRAGSDFCPELKNDRFSTSSAAEAEYYEYPCSPRSSALLIGAGGTHRQ